MSAKGRSEIQGAFAKTGVCPLNRDRITPDKLVSDPTQAEQQESRRDQESIHRIEHSSELNTGNIEMEVFDDQNSNISLPIQPTKVSAMTEKETIKSFPCPSWIEIDVNLHPAVANGIVDVSFAAAFIENASQSTSSTKKRKVQRDTSKGRCLTHASEVDRLEQISKDKKAKEEASAKRKHDQAQRKKKKNKRWKLAS